MIVLRDVSYSLGSGRSEVSILNRVSIQLPSDSRLAILALPGAGKSALLRLIAGAVEPQSGSIERYTRVSFPVGFGGGFRAKLSLKENICHVARMYGAEPSEVLDFVLGITDAEAFAQRALGDITPQLRSQISFALAYAIPFDTYLIDGRVGSGDPIFRERCEHMLSERASEAGFILATSFWRYARRFCDRAAILNSGNLVLYDSFEAACADLDRLQAEVGASVDRSDDDEE